MSYQEHQKNAEQTVARCAVITLSDTRTSESDKSGQTIQRLLVESGHQVADYSLIPDEPVELSSLLQQHLGSDSVDVILTNGGTGISQRDQTISVIEEILDQPIPGFGELFRMLSWDQIGSGAMLSRAIGGIAKGKLVFAMPGSTKAVELAMTRLILPELKHLLSEIRK